MNSTKIEIICSGGKHYTEEYPEQYISIYHDSDEYDRKTYYHDDEKAIYFQELQDNGNGWEVVYDSRERIDRTVEYPLPSWMFNNEPIPEYRHKINEDGEIESEFVGYHY